MPRLIELEATRTYATRENAIKAVEKKLGHIEDSDVQNVRYIIHTTKDGRFFPVFIGQDAMQAGIHHHFNIMF